MKIYIIMHLREPLESVFYTDEEKISKRVKELNELCNGGYWYKTFTQHPIV